MFISFPEFIYPCKTENYTARVKAGSVFSCQHNFTIGALARNLGKFSQIFCERMNILSNGLNNAKVIIFENDSNDGSDAVLKSYAAINPKFTVLSTKYNRPKNPQNKTETRKREMAEYRNSLLNAVKILSPPEYYVLVDSDVPGGYSLDGIYNSLSYDNWDCIGSNGLFYRLNEAKDTEKLYYDTWAFREYGSWEDKNVNTMNLSRGEEPFPVYSCFGGLAIYKWDAIKDLKYDESDCDHVTIAKQMIANGRNILCNPSQINIFNEISDDNNIDTLQST